MTFLHWCALKTLAGQTCHLTTCFLQVSHFCAYMHYFLRVVSVGLTDGTDV